MGFFGSSHVLVIAFLAAALGIANTFLVLMFVVVEVKSPKKVCLSSNFSLKYDL